MLASAPPPPQPEPKQQQPPSRRKATKIGWPNVMGCFGSAAAKTDHDDAKKGKETNKKINQQLQKDKQVYRATHRLLLLGERCVVVIVLVPGPRGPLLYFVLAFCLLSFPFRRHARLSSGTHDHRAPPDFGFRSTNLPIALEFSNLAARHPLRGRFRTAVRCRPYNCSGLRRFVPIRCFVRYLFWRS